MPSSIFIARVNRYIERLFNVKGGPAILDIDPTISIEVPFLTGVEDRYTQGWNRFGIANNQPAVAAQASGVQFRNPAGSNVVAVFEKIQFDVSTAGSWTLNLSMDLNAADMTTVTPNNGNRLDNRSLTQAPTLIFSRGNNFGDLSRIIGTAAQAAANSPFNYILSPNQELTLLPGDSIRINTGTVNVNLIATWIWRERALETSELVS